MFFYETSRISVNTSRGESITFDPLRCNAVKCYMEHYHNFLALDHVAVHGDFKERFQAEREIEICKRKMAYWRRQPHFVEAEALRQKSLLHRRTNR